MEGEPRTPCGRISAADVTEWATELARSSKRHVRRRPRSLDPSKHRAGNGHKAQRQRHHDALLAKEVEYYGSQKALLRSDDAEVSVPAPVTSTGAGSTPPLWYQVLPEPARLAQLPRGADPRLFARTLPYHYYQALPVPASHHVRAPHVGVRLSCARVPCRCMRACLPRAPR